MFANSKATTTVGLDIGTAGVAATEVRANGDSAVERTAIGPLPPGAVQEGEVQHPQDLARALKALFAENKLAKDVRVGIANQRVVVRTLRLPLIEDEDELETAIRFQAQDQIPMPLDQAVFDHQVLAKQAGGEGGERGMEVLAVAARRDMVSALLEALHDAGLRPVGIDLAAFGMIRALSDASDVGPVQTTTLYCHLGDITNLAVARGDACLFTRVAPFGLESIAAGLAERQELSLEDAREWLLDVGLDEPLDGFEAAHEETARAARAALEQGASKLIDELRLSLDFYSAQEGVLPIERVIVCGPGSAIQGLPDRVQTGRGRGIESRTPPALSHLDREDAARLTVSYGLALGE